MKDKSLILEFIKRHTLTVISTVDVEKPESAVIEFGQTDNLELIFNTLKNSRKYRNVKKNPYVSFVIGWDEKITVQYEGKAVELTGEELPAYKEKFLLKVPHARKWEKHPDITFFKVIPNWIRYSDLNVKPWDIKQLSF